MVFTSASPVCMLNGWFFGISILSCEHLDFSNHVWCVNSLCICMTVLLKCECRRWVTMSAGGIFWGELQLMQEDIPKLFPRAHRILTQVLVTTWIFVQ